MLLTFEQLVGTSHDTAVRVLTTLGRADALKACDYGSRRPAGGREGEVGVERV